MKKLLSVAKLFLAVVVALLQNNQTVRFKVSTSFSCCITNWKSIFVTKDMSSIFNGGHKNQEIQKKLSEYTFSHTLLKTSFPSVELQKCSQSLLKQDDFGLNIVAKRLLRMV